jgi:hypothetical protein
VDRDPPWGQVVDEKSVIHPTPRILQTVARMQSGAIPAPAPDFIRATTTPQPWWIALQRATMVARVVDEEGVIHPTKAHGCAMDGDA